MSKLCSRFVFLNRNRTCNVTISACVDFFILVKLLDMLLFVLYLVQNWQKCKHMSGYPYKLPDISVTIFYFDGLTP